MDDGWMIVLGVGGALILITIVYYSRLPAEPPPAPPPPTQTRLEHAAVSATARPAAAPLDPLPSLRLDQIEVIYNYRRQPNEARQEGLLALLHAYKKLNNEQRAAVVGVADAFQGARAWRTPEQPLLRLHPADLSGREKDILAVYDALPGEEARNALRYLLLVYDQLDVRQRQALREAAITLGPGPYS